jgi:hypothetical protein
MGVGVKSLVLMLQGGEYFLYFRQARDYLSGLFCACVPGWDCVFGVWGRYMVEVYLNIHG